MTLEIALQRFAVLSRFESFANRCQRVVCPFAPLSKRHKRLAVGDEKSCRVVFAAALSVNPLSFHGCTAVLVVTPEEQDARSPTHIENPRPHASHERTSNLPGRPGYYETRNRDHDRAH